MKKKFLSSLDAGNKGQKYFTNLLDANNIKYELSKLIDFDVKTISKFNFTFEVKFDIYASRSGNIAIEYWNSKKCSPSGVTATKADFWVHVLSESEIWIIKVSDLRSFCDKVKPFRTIENGGDDNSCMFLYKKEDIFKAPFLKIDKENLIEYLSSK